MAKPKRQKGSKRKTRSDVKRPIPVHILKALGHDTRLAIIEKMTEVERPVSPVELAKLIPGEELSSVSYHVGVLLNECGVIKLTRKQQVRGAMEHFYTRTAELKRFQGDGAALDGIADMLRRSNGSSEILNEIREAVHRTGRSCG